jgi:hypothetical protein
MLVTDAKFSHSFPEMVEKGMVRILRRKEKVPLRSTTVKALGWGVLCISERTEASSAQGCVGWYF